MRSSHIQARKIRPPISTITSVTWEAKHKAQMDGTKGSQEENSMAASEVYYMNARSESPQTSLVAKMLTVFDAAGLRSTD